MPALARTDEGQRAVRDNGAEQGFARAQGGSVGASLSSEVERVDGRPRFQCGEAKRRIWVRARLGAGIHDVPGWPVPNLEGTSRPDRGEAVPVGTSIIPRESMRMEGEEVLAVGVSSGSSIRVEGLQLSDEPCRDVPSTWLAERLVQFLRGRGGARRASGGCATSCGEREDFIVLARNAEATSMLEPKDGIALRGANTDLDHGLCRATVRRDRVQRRAPDRPPEEGLERITNNVTAHLPKCTHEPLQLVAVRRLGHEDGPVPSAGARKLRARGSPQSVFSGDLGGVEDGVDHSGSQVWQCKHAAKEHGRNEVRARERRKPRYSRAQFSSAHVEEHYVLLVFRAPYARKPQPVGLGGEALPKHRSCFCSQNVTVVAVDDEGEDADFPGAGASWSAAGVVYDAAEVRAP